MPNVYLSNEELEAVIGDKPKGVTVPQRVRWIVKQYLKEKGLVK